MYIPNKTLVWIIWFVYIWKWDWNRKWIATIISLTVDEILEVSAFRIIAIFLQSCALKMAVSSRIHNWLISTLSCWIFSCDQAALWTAFLSICLFVSLSVCLSVCLSVRLSVCPSVTPFWLCSHHRIIMKFSGIITKDQGRSMQNGKIRCQRSRSQRSQPNLTVSGL